MANLETKQKCELSVDGMHCSSCELLIEKKINNLKGIKSVKASLKDSKIQLEYEGRDIDTDEINRLFEENGYVFSKSKIAKTDQPLFSKIDNKLIINREKLLRLVSGIGITIIILVIFFLMENSKLGALASISQDSNFWSFFVFGIVAGFSSCAALVGGLLLSLSRQWSDIYIEKEKSVYRAVPFILFNVGRLISYAFLGGVLGYIGTKFGIGINSQPLLTAAFLTIVSIYMFILGLEMLGINWAKRFQLKLPKIITSKIVDETNFKGKFMPFLVGFLTFFLPCGFTLNVQALALSSGSISGAAMMLFAFALGTLPMLLIISLTSVKLAQKPKLNALFNLVAGMIVILFALYNINAQLNVAGLPSLSDLKFNTTSQQVKYTSKINSENQVLNSIASSTGYSPISAVLKAGLPTEWEIFDDGTTGCTNGIISSQLFGNRQIMLNTGNNVVQLPALEKGTYKYSCWMGMYSGVLKVI